MIHRISQLWCCSFKPRCRLNTVLDIDSWVLTGFTRIPTLDRSSSISPVIAVPHNERRSQRLMNSERCTAVKEHSETIPFADVYSFGAPCPGSGSSTDVQLLGVRAIHPVDDGLRILSPYSFAGFLSSDHNSVMRPAYGHYFSADLSAMSTYSLRCALCCVTCRRPKKARMVPWQLSSIAW